jgi:membrane fusion protein (multidrug efflux system)
MVIPESALLPQAEKQFVMVRIKKDGKDSVEKRQVKIGSRLPGYVEILSGLRADEYVVTHGNSKVRPGSIVDVLGIDDGTVDIATMIKGKKTRDNKP